MATVKGADGNTYTLGSQSYTNYLLGTKPGTSALTKETTPETVTDAQNATSFNIPDVKMSEGSVFDANAFASGQEGLLEVYTQQAKDAQAQREKATQENKPFLQELLSSATTAAKNVFGSRQEAEESTGYDQQAVQDYFASQKKFIKQYQSLQGEYDSIKNARDKQITDAQGRTATNNFINNQVAQIERNAAVKLNAVSSQMNALAAVQAAEQGLFNEAQTFIRQAVDDATAEAKWRFDVFNQFNTLYEDQISRLDTKYQNAFNGAVDLARTEWQNQRADKQRVAELMLEYRGAGISINDSLDTAYGKIDSSGAKFTGKGGSDLFTTTQSNSGAARAGLSISEFSSLEPDVQNYFINLSDSQADSLSDLFNDVASGATSYNEAVEIIDGKNITVSVKNYLKSQLPTSVSSGTSGSSWWDKLVNFGGNVIYDTFYKK